jgi:hypothetical protein
LDASFLASLIFEALVCILFKRLKKCLGQTVSGSVPPFWMPPAGGNRWGDLMNIGQAVREALDPFGVDVDIEVETPAGKQKVDKPKEAKENMTPEAQDR